MAFAPDGRLFICQQGGQLRVSDLGSRNGTRIDLTWVDNALSEDGYRVERAPDVDGAPGAYATIETLPRNGTGCGNTGLAVGTKVQVQFTFTDNGARQYSDQVTFEVRQRIQEVLTRRLEGTVLNYHLAMSAGDQARLHFYLSAPTEEVHGDLVAVLATLGLVFWWVLRLGVHPIEDMAATAMSITFMIRMPATAMLTAALSFHAHGSGEKQSTRSGSKVR